MCKPIRSACHLIVVIAFTLGTGTAHANPRAPITDKDGIAEYRLDNGLRILLASVPGSGAIAFNLIYLSGSLADPEGKGGTAHLLEHLMFKGTPGLPGDRLTAELARQGIAFNATTSFDRTRYTTTLSADPEKLDYLLAIEADRMVNASLDPKEIGGVVDVVTREMELAQDTPLGALMTRMLAAATPGKGFGRPVLGTQGELKNITADDIRKFHAHHYHPGNTVIVITGEFDRQQTLAAIEKHFGPIPARPAGATGSPVQATPQPDRPATAQVRRGSGNWIAVAYPIPAASDPDNTALAVLADILANEPHGRLYQALVVTDKAMGVFAQQLSLKSGGYYLFGAMLGETHSIAAARDALVQHLEKIGKQPITKEELQRFQNASRHTKSQILGEHRLLAELLSESTAAGDWQLFLKRLDDIPSLAVRDVQKKAEQHFKEQRRIVGELTPDSSTAQSAAAGASPVAHEIRAGSDRKKESTATDQTARESDREAGDAPQAIDLEAFNRRIIQIENSIHRSTTGNGLKIALRPTPGSGNRVQGTLNLRFGDEKSLYGKKALTDLVGTVLIRGTRNLTFQQVVDRINGMGAGIVIKPDGDTVAVHFESDAKSLPDFLALMADILKNPAFPKAEFELIKRQQMAALSQPVDQPAAVATLQLNRHSYRYPEGDIRRHTENPESLAALKKITRDDAIRFHQDFYGANHGEIALAGDFDMDATKRLIEQLFGDWNSKAGHSRPAQPYQETKATRIHARANAPQTGHYISRLHFIANNRSEDAPALFMAEHILGRNQFTSRLNRRLREQEGLTYGMQSSIKVATFDNASWITIQAGYPTVMTQ